jgi:tRNA nucleotidyltransferase (CCA-adding enzyme)
MEAARVPPPPTADAGPIRGIIIGHSNMDLDCLASLALARYLHPGYAALKSSRINPLAKNLFNMYQEHLGLLGIHDIDPAALAEVVVVDTRSRQQVTEFLDRLEGFRGKLTVYDHHREARAAAPDGVGGDGLGIGTILPSGGLQRIAGANASLLVGLLRERGLSIGAEDATIALAGIYADTGNFCHDNVTAEDFAAAEWLIGQGASLGLVRKFTTSLFDRELTAVMHELVVRLEPLILNGQHILTGQVELDRQPAGLAMLVERLFELEHADALFCVFALRKEQSHLIIARSSGAGVDVAFILSQFGGGGHCQSASALVRKSHDIPVLGHLRQCLQLRLKPTVRAADLMSRQTDCLREDMSLMEAALELESRNHSGAPMLDARSRLCGMLCLKDIQKGRKGGRMHTPVKAWMSRDPLTISPDTSLREIEAIFFQTELNRLPVMDGLTLVGLVCRSDYLSQVRRGGAQAGA